MTLALTEPSPTGTAFSCTRSCTLCGSSLRIVLDLGRQPLANALLKSADEVAPVYPLRLGHCTGCGHLQLADTVPPAALFTDYVYRTGSSRPMVEHFGLLGQIIPTWMGGLNKLVVDVGSNDGTLLRALRGAEHKHAGGFKALGVDPSSVAREVPGTIAKFFSRATAAEILAEHGPAGCVVMANVLAHSPNPRDLLEGARDLLAYGGLLVIEVPYSGDFNYSQCYAEHFHYFTATVIERLLYETGFAVRRVQPLAVHGGTLRIFARRLATDPRDAHWKGRRAEVVFEGQDPDEWLGMLEMEDSLDWARRWGRLQEQAEIHRTRLRELCDGLCIGYGAPAKATVLLNWTGLHPTALYDTTPEKAGRFVPGVNVPILPMSEMPERARKVLLCCWNYAEDVLRRETRYAGRWVIPFPDLRIA